jgi:hypothetical protein
MVKKSFQKFCNELTDEKDMSSSKYTRIFAEERTDGTASAGPFPASAREDSRLLPALRWKRRAILSASHGARDEQFNGIGVPGAQHASAIEAPSRLYPRGRVVRVQKIDLPHAGARSLLFCPWRRCRE